ncbi:MAG: MBL fold metallo-hydrolase [Planctomycetota bacterium]
MLDLRIVSIGALAAHPLRGERQPVRTGHATTTLILAGDNVIVVDPGLPRAALEARLEERAGLVASAVTHVFLTSFKPDTARGISAFESAKWFLSEAEREAVGVPLAQAAKRVLAQEAEDGLDDDPLATDDVKETLRTQLAVLQRCEAAPDKLAPGVDLFPLPGVTPGLCGLLLATGKHATLVCGDAVPTVEHLEQGKLLPGAADVELAQESYAEAIEIADVLVPGRDNWVINPTKRPF